MNKTSISAFGNKLVFYLIAFFTGIVVLPVTGGMAFAFLLGGAICPIGGFIKLIGNLFGYNVPISLFDIGSLHMPPSFVFLLSVVFGIALLFAGKGLWTVTRKYIAWIREKKRTMLDT